MNIRAVGAAAVTIALVLLLAGKPSAVTIQATAFDTSSKMSAQLLLTALNIAFGSQDGSSTIHDSIAGDCPAINILIDRVNALLAAHPNTSAPASFRSNAETHRTLLLGLNKNSAMVTPSSPAGCAWR